MKQILLTIVPLLLFVVSLRAQDTAGSLPYKRVQVHQGERCLVCDGAVDTTDGFVLLVKGRRVPLDSMHLAEFLKNREKYFSLLQPRGALFAESFDETHGPALGGVSWGWFLFGLHVLVALVFAGLSGYVAVGKGLRPLPHFALGLVFSVLGFLYVLTRPSCVRPGEVPAGLVKVPATRTPVPCMKCGTGNHPSARQCAGCGTALTPRSESEVTRAR